MNTDEKYVIKPSVYTLFFTIVIVEVILGIFTNLIKLPFKVYSDPADSYNYSFEEEQSPSRGVMSFFASLLLLFLRAGIIGYFATQWASTTYTIGPKELTIQKGVMRTTQDSYETALISSVSAQQNLLGRLFGYSNLHLQASIASNNVTLKNIPNPRYYADIITHWYRQNLSPTPSPTQAIPVNPSESAPPIS